MPLIEPTWRTVQRYAETDAIKQATPELLDQYTAVDPDRTVIADADHELTARELMSAVSREQDRLRAAGVGRGDVVCTQLPNWWEAIAFAHAAWGMGAVLCPVPVNYRTAEISAILAAVPVAAYIGPQRFRSANYGPMVTDAADRAGIAVPWLPVVHGHVTDTELAESSDQPELVADLDLSLIHI